MQKDHESELTTVAARTAVRPGAVCTFPQILRRQVDMKQAIVRLLPLLLACTFPCLADAPSIVRITNSAVPDLDSGVLVQLEPRSLATVFGTNLADAPASTTPPWQKVLGGVELHLV